MLGNILKSRFISTGIAVFCFICTCFLQISQLSKLSRQGQELENKLAYKADIRSQKATLMLLREIPAFGFDNLIANWIFLSFLQYFGDGAARSATSYSLSPLFFEVIVDRDPRFISPYHFLSTSTSLYVGEPDTSVALMEKGLQSLSSHSDPNAYFVWLYKATDELLFLGDYHAARRSYTKVVDWAQENGDAESQRLANISARTAKFLEDKANSKSAQINAWLLVFVNSVDDSGRQRAIENIKQLGGEISFGENGSVSVKHPPED